MSNIKTAENSTLRERMQTSRWSPERWAMDALAVGETMEMTKVSSTHSLVKAMNNAFWGERSWSYKPSEDKKIHLITRDS